MFPSTINRRKVHLRRVILEGKEEYNTIARQLHEIARDLEAFAKDRGIIVLHGG